MNEKDDYQRGLNDAVNAVKWLFRNVPDEDIFDGNYVEDILMLHSIKEIIEFIDDYKIEIGDEVIPVSGNHDPFVVTITDGVYVQGIDSKGNTRGCTRKESEFKKTGRYFPEVRLLLARMEGTA